MTLHLRVKCSTLMSFTSASPKFQPQISCRIPFCTSSTYPLTSVAAMKRELSSYPSCTSTNQVTAMAENKHNQPHVLSITFPFGSHPALLLNIVHRLAADAPEASFSFLGTAKSNATLLGSVDAAISGGGIDNIKFYDVEDGVAEDHVLSGMEEIDFFMNAAPGSFNKAIDKAISDTNKKITCVISDAFVWKSGIIAEEFGVPWISIWTISASFLACHFHIDLIRETIYGDSEPLSPFPGMSLVRSSDLPPWIFAYNEFEEMLDMLCKTIPRATAVAANSFEALEDACITIELKSQLKMFLPVGPFFAMACPPLLGSDPHGCMSWLDGHKPDSVVYVSFQTMTPPAEELTAFAEGLEASGLAFLWSIEDYAKVHIPVGFAERTRAKGKIVPSAPQTQILQHSAIGVFVTHSGWAAMMESIVAGVPIIFRPRFGDQHINGRFMSHHWGIGITGGDIDDDHGRFTKGDTTNALNLIMRTAHGKRMKMNIQYFKEKAIQAVGPNGSSTNNFKALLDIVTRGKS